MKAKELEKFNTWWFDEYGEENAIELYGHLFPLSEVPTVKESSDFITKIANHAFKEKAHLKTNK